MESGIHGCGIRNPQAWNPESTAWNPESKTLLDYITRGETFTNASLMTVSALLHPENKNLTNSSVQSILSIQLYKIHMENFLDISIMQQQWPAHHRSLQSKKFPQLPTTFLLPLTVNNSTPLSQFLRMTQTPVY